MISPSFKRTVLTAVWRKQLDGQDKEQRRDEEVPTGPR